VAHADSSRVPRAINAEPSVCRTRVTVVTVGAWVKSCVPARACSQGRARIVCSSPSRMIRPSAGACQRRANGARPEREYNGGAPAVSGGRGAERAHALWAMAVVESGPFAHDTGEERT
jgi:hypothetical protein